MNKTAKLRKRREQRRRQINMFLRGEVMEKVSKEEFQDFLKSYPNELTRGTTNICEPPFTSYIDKSLPSDAEVGSSTYFFDREVARVEMDWVGPNGELDDIEDGRFWVYKINTNLRWKL